MITKTRQNWTSGQTVKVGFLSLMVVQAIPTHGDYAPDAYLRLEGMLTRLIGQMTAIVFVGGGVIAGFNSFIRTSSRRIGCLFRNIRNQHD